MLNAGILCTYQVFYARIAQESAFPSSLAKLVKQSIILEVHTRQETVG
jgi:hypothetical protein